MCDPSKTPTATLGAACITCIAITLANCVTQEGYLEVVLSCILRASPSTQVVAGTLQQHVHDTLCCCLQDQERGHLQQLQSLMPSYRARPSLLGPLAAAAGFSLGAAAGVLPTRFAHAITGKLHDLMTAGSLSLDTVKSCLEP